MKFYGIYNARYGIFNFFSRDENAFNLALETQKEDFPDDPLYGVRVDIWKGHYDVTTIQNSRPYKGQESNNALHNCHMLIGEIAHFVNSLGIK